MWFDENDSGKDPPSAERHYTALFATGNAAGRCEGDDLIDAALAEYAERLGRELTPAERDAFTQAACGLMKSTAVSCDQWQQTDMRFGRQRGNEKTNNETKQFVIREYQRLRCPPVASFLTHLQTEHGITISKTTFYRWMK